MWKASEQLQTLDEVVRYSLQDVCNIKMDPAIWTQTTLL